jgi:hypothetical protein
MKRFTSLAAAVFTAAFLAAATTVSAQDSNIDQRTYMTFSGPVQMPGVTLPPGKYTFILADTALHNIMRVYDDKEQHIIGQWFFIPRERTTDELDKANGKPVVMFTEMPAGVPPAIHYFFYPTDLRGKEFVYPKEQALKIAKASNTSVLATDTDVTKGGDAHVFRVNPNGTEASENETASNAEQNTAPAASASATDQSATSNRPAATSGADDQNQNAAPRQQASAQLPKTASPIQLIGLIGLLSLAGGFGVRMARNN